MFQSESQLQDDHLHHGANWETSKQRSERMKKNRGIRKEKLNQKRNNILQADSIDKEGLTREQRRFIQKEKNRVAAQHSRDRQKKYLEDLETKISEMERQIESQLCRKCRASLSDHSTSEEEHHQESQIYDSMTSPAVIELQRSRINLLEQEREIEELPFTREDSRSDMEWGNIGKYFCIFLVVLSVALLSNSVETTQGEFSPVRPVSRILTQNRGTCSNGIEKNTQIAPPITLQQAKLDQWPFKRGTGEPLEECKNQFWEHYFKDIRNTVSNGLANPYDWNLVTCSNPSLIHISTVYDKSVDHLEDKWTFLITNPVVSQVLAESNGGYHIDEVSYLDGVYQLIAEKVVLKKVVGDSCLM